MTSLAALLRERIRAGGGSISFADFMDVALYAPGHGYYASERAQIGRAGDFFTSVSVGPIFGELFAEQIVEVWETMGRPVGFMVAEAGANDGRLAHDILTWIRRERPDCAAVLTYWIDEPLAILQARQAARLGAFGDQVQWGRPEKIMGVFLANELLDALPFLRVRWTGTQWVEMVVGASEVGWEWRERKIDDREIRAFLAALPGPLVPGYTTEVAPAVSHYVADVTARLAHGVAFWIDYGFARTDYYLPERTNGTLRCYRAHRASDDPLAEPGEADITAHVDFSRVAEAARRAGGDVVGWVDQGRCLTGMAHRRLLASESSGPPLDAAWKRQFQTLTHPGQMGRSFHVMIVAREMPKTFALAGLRFASPTTLATLG
jgi:SAM-dependent MidA family methyltransferase